MTVDPLDPRDDQVVFETPSPGVVAGKTPPAATDDPTPDQLPLLADPNSRDDHRGSDAQLPHVVAGQTPPAAIAAPIPNPGLLLADPLLTILADAVDDLEKVRIANENRHRQLTRTGVDKDGIARGFGLDDRHPAVARLGGIVDSLAWSEKQAISALQKQMRAHPLADFQKRHKGIGEKQLARLLSVIGDPYWNTLHGRPRKVSELWAYCGYHTLPASHPVFDAHIVNAGGSDHPTDQGSRETGTMAASSVGSQDSGNPQQQHSDIQAGLRVAAKRRKGQRANWSTLAKTRTYLIAESCMKQKPGNRYRDVYDKRRAHTALTHPDWPKGHSHNDALRITAKEFLKDLWREARAIHGVTDEQAAS